MLGGQRCGKHWGYDELLVLVQHSRVGGVTVSMVAFQAVDPGSTPGRRTLLFFIQNVLSSQQDE